MYFQNLDKHIQDAIINLTNDDIFQNRFATDPILDSIDSFKENKSDEYKGIMAVLRNTLLLEGKKINCITPAVWSFLWVIDSPFVTNDNEPTELDVDIFLYILFNGIGTGNSMEIPEKAHKYTTEYLQWSYEEAITLIKASIYYSFKPLQLFPTSNSSGKVSFDADWLTSVVARVHSVTGYTPEYILHEMSLAACCYYFAQYRRAQGDDTIYKRTDEEILIMQMERSVELICDRLIELNVIAEDDRAKYKKIMCTPPAKIK